VDSSQQVAVNSSSNRTCVSIAIMNNRAVEETVETFMVVLDSSDPYVTLNPGASNATVSIIDSSSNVYFPYVSIRISVTLQYKSGPFINQQ